MSIKLIQQAWDSPLKGNDLLVLISLADNASDEGYCWPSWKTIMKKTKVSKGTLSNVLNRLEQDNFISRESRKRTNGSDASNGYFILQNIQSSEIEHHTKVQKLNTTQSSEVEQGGVQELNYQSSEVEHLYEPSLNRNIESSITPYIPHNNLVVNSIPYKEIIDYLNNVLGTKYKHDAKETKKLIKARFDDGFTLNDFNTVIHKKAMQWKLDAKMKVYLRPETLFGSKFEGYLNQIISDYDKAKAIQEHTGMSAADTLAIQIEQAQREWELNNGVSK